MRMKSQDNKEKKKITPNVPVGGTAEVPQNEIHRGSNPVDIDKLAGRLQRCDIGYDYNSYSSDNEEERNKLEKILIAKSPDKIKDQNRQQIKNGTQPYHTTRVEVSQSRGRVMTQTTCNNSLGIYFHQIPQPVIDYCTGRTADDSIERIYAALDEENRRKLDDILDQVSKVNPTKSLLSFPQPCNSPDSSYSSMSPSSVSPSSPYLLLHSPNPPVEQMKVPESDSLSSDFELGLSESLFGPVETNRLQPCISNSPPSRQNNINCQMPQRSQPPPRYLQLVPSLRPIRPDSGVIVHEHGLTNTAEDRLTKQNIMKKDCLYNQYRLAVFEVKPLAILKKKEENRLTPSEREELKKIKNILRQNLISLIKEGPNQHEYFYEWLYSRIKLYNRMDCDILTAKDEHGYTPLYAAAILQPQNPLIARLLADIMEDFGKLDDEDNTILHYIAKQGDSHAQVLSELLHSKRFDVNHKNVGSKTALHVAIECHNNKSCLACVKQFVKHGADLKLKDFTGQTALHLAVTLNNGDPLILKALLQSPSVVYAINSYDNENNTPLHLAAARNDLPLLIQKELVDQLVCSGA